MIGGLLADAGMVLDSLMAQMEEHTQSTVRALPSYWHWMCICLALLTGKLITKQGG